MWLIYSKTERLMLKDFTVMSSARVPIPLGRRALPSTIGTRRNSMSTPTSTNTPPTTSGATRSTRLQLLATTISNGASTLNRPETTSPSAAGATGTITEPRWAPLSESSTASRTLTPPLGVSLRRPWLGKTLSTRPTELLLGPICHF